MHVLFMSRTRFNETILYSTLNVIELLVIEQFKEKGQNNLGRKTRMYFSNEIPKVDYGDYD